MTLTEQLKRTRKALLPGWVGSKLEPWCRDERGRRVHHADEGVHTFSVMGALQLHGELEPALEFLGRIVSPGLAALRDFEAAHPYEQVASIAYDSERDWMAPLEERPTAYEQLEAEWYALQHRAAGEPLGFQWWLIQEGRTVDDVLRVLTTAVVRSAREKCT